MSALDTSTMNSFLTGLADGRIELQQCTSCRVLQAPPLPLCRRCGGSQLCARTASGLGTVVALSRVSRRLGVGGPRPPYDCVVVELDEGPRILGVAADSESLRIGDQVLLRDGTSSKLTFGRVEMSA